MFYNDLIFLEDYISHTDGRVYKSPNKDEIFEASYNKIMGFTFEDVEDTVSLEELLSSSSKNKENPKKSLSQEDEVILSDTESLEVLEDYKEIVIPSLFVKNSAPKPLDVPICQNREERQIAEIRMRTEKLNLLSNEAVHNSNENWSRPRDQSRRIENYTNFCCRTCRFDYRVMRSIHHSARRLCNVLHHRCNIGARRPFETAKTSKMFWASVEAFLRLTTALDSSSLLQANAAAAAAAAVAASVVVVVLQAPHVRAPTPTYWTTVSAGATVVVCAQHVHHQQQQQQQQQLFSWPSGGHLRRHRRHRQPNHQRQQKQQQPLLVSADYSPIVAARPLLLAFEIFAT
ncbi:unnamed protein product [Trichogramma brassicae]|uniref:Uncharacterized protein n=1 Tax=Trichogramma brassicae TaxID=86971 RepID=A0A6H5I8X6_9HYME|nr:unnamed protein product [Trichogramma brassicae]